MALFHRNVTRRKSNSCKVELVERFDSFTKGKRVSSHELARKLLSLPEVFDVIIRGDRIREISTKESPAGDRPSPDLFVKDVKMRSAVLVEGDNKTTGDVIEMQVDQFVSGMVYL